MKRDIIKFQDLLIHVAEQLSKISSVTDYLMLIKWKIISICQYLISTSNSELKEACYQSLNIFINYGPGNIFDSFLKAINDIIIRTEGSERSLLPSISEEMRYDVSIRLNNLSRGGMEIVDRALILLPFVYDQIKKNVHPILFPGIQYRLECVSDIIKNLTSPEKHKIRAAAAILYLYDEEDVIPDIIKIIGITDDDYALRIVLEENDEGKNKDYLHWSEKILFLWDNIKYIQGINLKYKSMPISLTWLDRINSYISYLHVTEPKEKLLILLQPSISCTPLHLIVSLLGSLVFDLNKLSKFNSNFLRLNQIYEVYNSFVEFRGISDEPSLKGRLRLRMRDGIIYEPPELASLMIPVSQRRLSLSKDFYSRKRSVDLDPVQRFFDWHTTIGPASISSILVLVTSRQRALHLLEEIESNGVFLIKNGFVRFIDSDLKNIEVHGSLIFVVPSLNIVNALLDQKISIKAIIVDEYKRLYHGRHDLPFLLNRSDSPPIINWSFTGYYPNPIPTWLPPCKLLEVSTEDLDNILNLDESSFDPIYIPLWESNNRSTIKLYFLSFSVIEIKLIEAINLYIKILNSSLNIPDYLKYHLIYFAKSVKKFINSTPSEWSEIKIFFTKWSSFSDEKFLFLRSKTDINLKSLKDAENLIFELICCNSDIINSRGTALVNFLSDPLQAEINWYLVCDCLDQIKIALIFLKKMNINNVQPKLLRDLAACSQCLVVGWMGTSFARRLWAHTPHSTVILVDDGDRQRWERAAESQRQTSGQSILSAVGGLRHVPNPIKPPLIIEQDPQTDEVDFKWDNQERVRCVFLWLTGESDIKILDPSARVVIEEGSTICEREAARLRPDDRVILGLGTSRWSPADEFTGAVVSAVETSHPELVKTAKEWRQALRRLLENRCLSIAQLRVRLGLIGVKREEQTLDGWLDLNRASPIAPKGQSTELAAIWQLVQPYTMCSLDDVITACTRLRALRTASGRALLQRWKGRSVELEIDEEWLGELVNQLRREVQVYEIEAIISGEVPRAMLGLWISSTLAESFESESTAAAPMPLSSWEDSDVG
jgi:hypothetical protein